jgi:type IV pilus assembly PilN-like protein
MAWGAGTVKPPAINLARRPFRNNSLYWSVFGTCFALLLVASGYNIYDFVLKGRELSRLRQDLADNTQAYQRLVDSVEKMKHDIDKLNLASLDSKSSFANGLIVSRLFSWSRLFDRIEDIIPPDVKIRSIRPSITPKMIEIQIDGMARTPDVLYEFQKNLDDSDYFSSVYPVSESTRETKGELNFDLVMNYVPAGRTPHEPGAPVSPPTPTAGLPQPETGSQDANQPAGAAPRTPADAAGAAQPGAPPVPPAGAPAGAATGFQSSPAGPAAGVPASTAASTPASPPATSPVPQPQPPQPQQPHGARTGKAGAPPPGATGISVKDISELTDEQFIEQFGYVAYLQVRGHGKGKGKGKAAAPPNPDPNAVAP